MPNAPFICVECGAANAAVEGPCVACGSKAHRGERDRPKAGETYQKVADTIGLVPNARWKDNLYQGFAVLVIAGIGVLIGFLLDGGEGALAGLLLGLVAGLLLSGAVLMVVGWVRTVKRS